MTEREQKIKEILPLVSMIQGMKGIPQDLKTVLIAVLATLQDLRKISDAEENDDSECDAKIQAISDSLDQFQKKLQDMTDGESEAFDSIKEELDEIRTSLQEISDGIEEKAGKDGLNGTNGKDGLNGTNGINGKDGRDGRFISATEIADKLETLTGDKRVSVTAIKGLEDFIDEKVQFFRRPRNTVGGGVQSVISSDGSVLITSTGAKGKGVVDLKVVGGGGGTWGSITGTLSNQLDLQAALDGKLSTSATTSDVAEGTRLYFTNARVIASTLTGYVSGSGTISATDTVLSAIQKLNGNIALLTGAVIFQGTWNANTNTPTLASGVGTKGFLYKVSVAGTTNIDGISQWNVGDTIVFDGTVWDKIDGVANEVLSVSNSDGTLSIPSTVGAVVASLNLAHANTWTGIMTLSPSLRTSGSASYFTINAPADTGITANTESRGVNIVGATRTWADGTVASQSEYYFGTPTYNKTTTSATFTQAQTAYFGAAPIAGTGVTITNGYSAWFHGNVHIGTQLGGSPFAPIGGTGLEVSDSNTTAAGQQVGCTNTSNSIHAFCGFALFNDLANGSAYTHYAGAFYNSSLFTDTAFGTAFAIANQLSLYGTDGPTLIGTIATGSAAYLNVVIGGASTTNEVARFTTSSLGLTSIALNESVGGTLASASTVNIGAATGNYLTISGSVTITAFDTVQAGTRRVVTFTGTPILTNSSALVLPWGNITVVAGDSATFVSKGGGNWICTQYQRSTSTGSGAVVFAAAPTFTGTATFGAITTNSASTQSIGGVTLNIGGNTTTTTANILGGATVNTAISTVNINQGATASGGTKVTNISTQGLAGSTTTISIGSASGTSTTTLSGQIILSDTVNLAINATTGTKIGTATSQKIGFWNATPIVQPTTAVTAATFVANTSGISNDTATWDGYTVGQIVKALRNMGLLA